MAVALHMVVKTDLAQGSAIQLTGKIISVFETHSMAQFTPEIVISVAIYFTRRMWFWCLNLAQLMLCFAPDVNQN